MTMGTGAAVGLGLAFALNYSTTLKHPSRLVEALAPTVVMFAVLFARTRRGGAGVTPMWSLSRRQRRAVGSAIREGAPLADPRLAAAAIEHVWLAKRVHPRALLGFIPPFVVTVAIWVSSIHRHGVINDTLVLPCAAAVVGLLMVRLYVSVRRLKLYGEPSTPER
jgi:hypothetical protein